MIFFKYLADEPNKEYYAALGSRQQVKVKEKFQSATLDAYDFVLTAIKAGGQDSANNKWKKVFGRNFPAAQTVQKSKSLESL